MQTILLKQLSHFHAAIDCPEQRQIMCCIGEIWVCTSPEERLRTFKSATMARHHEGCVTTALVSLTKHKVNVSTCIRSSSLVSGPVRPYEVDVDTCTSRGP